MFHILFAFLAALMVSQKPLQDEIILKKEFIYEKASFVECHASSIEVTADGMIRSEEHTSELQSPR